jgi:hypothetical protein
MRLLAALDLHLLSDCSQAFVGCPYKTSFDKTGGEEMDINQADATTVEAVALNEKQNLVVVSCLNARERMNKGYDLPSVLQVAACNFANYEWVSTDLLCIQQSCKACARLTEVINPYRRIHKNHFGDLRRGTRFACGSVPPSAARR